MTREEAVAWLREDIKRINHGAFGCDMATSDRLSKEQVVKRTAIAALQPWVRTADRVPTEEDADHRGWVLAYDVENGQIDMVHYTWVKDAPFLQWWTPIPTAPKGGS